MKRLRNYKVAASSLMESVIATSIIAICIVIASIVFVNVFKRNYATDYIQAQQELHTIIHQLKQQATIEDDVYEFSNFKIEQKVNTYESDASMQQIDFKISTSAKTATFSYLIAIKDEL
jgi:sensor domain CHASE-containing protein